VNHKGTKTIETERLILRKFTKDDVHAAYRNWTSDDAVAKYLSWPPHRDISTTERVLSEWIASYANPSFYQWAIELKSIGEPIGTISVVGMDEKLKKVSIGYCIGSKWWHQGITSEALNAVIPFLFEEVGVNRIECQYDTNNPRSGSVMQRCGLKYEGTLRQAHLNNRGIVDVCVYSMLRDEYSSRESK
jgi:ribosomal-protein-alanine N-acetyltransferase